MLNTTARAKAAAAIIEATTTNTTTTNTNINNNRASFSSASDFSSSRRKQTTWEDENGVTTAESTNIKDGVSSSNKSGIRDFTSIEKDRSLWTQDNQGVVCTDDTTGLQTENNTLTLIDSMESVEVEYVPSSSLVMSQSMDAAAAVPSFDVVPSGSELPPPPPNRKKKSRMKTLLSKARPKETAAAPQPQLRMMNDDNNNNELIGMDFSKLLLLGEQAVATEEESLLGSNTVPRSQSQRFLRSDAAAIGTPSSWEDIRFWLRKHPTNADRRKALLDYKDEYGATPLHLICRHGKPPSDILHTIIQAK